MSHDPFVPIKTGSFAHDDDSPLVKQKNQVGDVIVASVERWICEKIRNEVFNPVFEHAVMLTNLPPFFSRRGETAADQPVKEGLNRYKQGELPWAVRQTTRSR